MLLCCAQPECNGGWSQNTHILSLSATWVDVLHWLPILNHRFIHVHVCYISIYRCFLGSRPTPSYQGHTRVTSVVLIQTTWPERILALWFHLLDSASWYELQHRLRLMPRDDTHFLSRAIEWALYKLPKRIAQMKYLTLPSVIGKIVFKTILEIENIIVFKTILKILLQNTFENRK